MEGLKYEQITKEMLYSINEIKEIFRVGAVFTTIKKNSSEGNGEYILKRCVRTVPLPFKAEDRDSNIRAAAPGEGRNSISSYLHRKRIGSLCVRK